jgi:hypothetical protein
MSCSICPTGKYANTGSSACDSEPYCVIEFDEDLEPSRPPICLCPEGYTSPDQDPGCVFDPEFYIE